MIRVKCINPNAPPARQVRLGRTRPSRGGPAQPEETGAISFLVDCPFCGTENKVWLFKVKPKDAVTREPMASEPAEVTAAQPSAMDRFWLDTARSAAKESIAALEEAAKQLITIASLTQGIYFAAISFSDLKKVLLVQDLQGWFLVLLFASPIILWLISLAYAMRVFSPETYKTNLQSPDLQRRCYSRWWPTSIAISSGLTGIALRICADGGEHRYLSGMDACGQELKL